MQGIVDSIHTCPSLVLKAIFPILIIMFAPGTASTDERFAKIKESEWMAQSELDLYFRKLRDSRFMPFKIVGKKDGNDLIFYKGYFIPFPPNLDRFYAYWAMTDKTYRVRKTTLENLGYQEIWHQSFHDAVEVEIHQAVWMKLHKPNDDKKPQPENKDGTGT